MKNTLVAAILGAILAFPALADPVFGIWKTSPADNGNFAHVEIKQCEDAICGEMQASFDENGKKYKSENLGKNIVWNMKSQTDGKYADGKIWDPVSDKTYNSKMVLVDGGMSLEVKGCIAFLCKTRIWSRIN